MPFPGPDNLGRGVVVAATRDLPPAFADAPVVWVDDDVLTDPTAGANRLHELWLYRRRVVVVLDVPVADLRAPQTEGADPWTLDPSFEFGRERLQFLVWANNYDWRSNDPRWWWATKAARLGATETESGPTDIVLTDDTPAWCDGGPREPIALPDGHAVVHADTIDRGRLHAARHRSPTAVLAGDQHAAVINQRGAARVIAPAGSGKTRVLTERLRHLLVDRGVEADVITAVAFNRRAAEELTERTAGLSPHIRTLNALGLAVCNGTGGFAEPAGRPRRRVIEEPDVRGILSRLVDLRLATNTDPLAPYLEALTAVRLGLEDPDAVEATYGDVEGFAGMFRRYSDVLEREALLDFDHQVYEAIRVLLTDPAARRQAQRLARHLLVDEFQDLTPAHMLLLRMMAAPAYDVFGVGDDDQVIYGYASASPRFLLDYDTYFPGAAHYALEVNYRCPPAVVDAALNVLSHNVERIPKQVRPAPDRTPAAAELEVQRLPADELAMTCVDRVQAWIDTGAAPKSLAVLCRVNAALLPVQVLTAERGIPATAPLDASILSRTGIRSALAYLRIGLQPDRIARADLLGTIRRPSRRIARNVVEMLTKRPSTSVDEIRRLATYLTGGDAGKLDDYADDLGAVTAAVATGDVRRALRVIRTRVGLGGAMDLLDGARREADRSTHKDDLLALEAVAAFHRDPGTFQAWLTDVLARGGDGEGVQLSTIHRVKGREWDRVIVYGATDDLMPHRLAGDLEEERRVFHVAITRCRQQVVVLGDVEEPSPFLAELRRPASPGERPSPRPRPRVREVKPEGPARPAAADPKVVEALKAWRRDAAAAHGVPAYVVLHDRHLEAIAAALPRSVEQLRRCPGIGPSRLDRYGDEILAVIDSVAADS